MFEWENAPDWGHHSEINTFQVWIGRNGVEDISYVYGPVLSEGDGIPDDAVDSNGDGVPDYLSPAPTQVPTLSSGGIVAAALLLGAAGWVFIRRRAAWSG